MVMRLFRPEPFRLAWISESLTAQAGAPIEQGIEPEVLRQVRSLNRGIL